MFTMQWYNLIDFKQSLYICNYAVDHSMSLIIYLSLSN